MSLGYIFMVLLSLLEANSGAEDEEAGSNILTQNGMILHGKNRLFAINYHFFHFPCFYAKKPIFLLNFWQNIQPCDQVITTQSTAILQYSTLVIMHNSP